MAMAGSGNINSGKKWLAASNKKWHLIGGGEMA
jgi:hypothetical protein